MIKYNNGYEGVLEKTLTSTASIALALINLLLSQDPRRTMDTDPGETKNSAGPQTLTLLLEGSLTTGVHLDSPGSLPPKHSLGEPKAMSLDSRLCWHVPLTIGQAGKCLG
jgi:hypothetical protein